MRYFIEIAYHGAGYAGFQVQKNAITIQQELEKAFEVLFRSAIQLTGSSRTDAGVHAKQNYFHFDSELTINPGMAYNLNSILPKSISVKSLSPMPEGSHCRFDATARVYRYYLIGFKNPFYHDRSWYYPYPLDLEKLNRVAATLQGRHDFTSFSKRNTQVKTMICDIIESHWEYQGDLLVYTVQANRFLRGMVRGLVATMLQVGRGKISPEDFSDIIDALDCSRADFSAPPHGLFLEKVVFPDGYFEGEV